MDPKDAVEAVLAHHGVKGMKWGVRKSGGAARAGSPESVTVRAKPGKKVKTSGGRGHHATEDAIGTAVVRQRAKKSSTHSLSNHELQTAIKRMQLEQQFNQLNHQTKSAGGKFVDHLLGRSGNTKADKAARSTTGKAVKGAFSTAKTFSKAGAAAAVAL